MGVSVNKWRMLRLVKTLAFAGGGLMVAVVAISTILPAEAAMVCPAYYGFERIEPGVYIERTAAAEEQSDASHVLAEAQLKFEQFYGHLHSSPRILICISEACYRHLRGGGSTGMAVLTLGLVLSARGMTPVIAAHELSHIELHARLGLLRTWRREVPQWFDEGVAVVVSDDPRYLAPAGSPDRCLVVPQGALPTARTAWTERANSKQLYAKAACRVSRWMVRNGGAKAVIELADRVSKGASFDDAYTTSPSNQSINTDSLIHHAQQAD